MMRNSTTAAQPLLITLLILGGLLVSGCSNSPPAAKPSDAFIATATDVVDKLIATSFPELQQAHITVKGIDSDSVFLATDIVIPSLFTEQRQYILYLHPRLEQQPMSALALEGILAHELVHFTDYTKMSVPQLAIFYAKYLSSADFGAEYERATDLQSFERGYAAGIKEFRWWLYQQISAEAKQLKERNYYTPEEIDQWLSER